ncbi:peptide ABC transporter substrate-binding protein [Alicyclobacillus sp. SP_1]|uniref:peptide ABC transporter substrate-binding protein n=1 Tax=Alicyclobacillus sp. SP_1 TaxID=2942475 RepID=UPI0021580BE7|nr:peptide ABC transporter substrate-binding protein [Alicyclobacillus sp. SP_1]
MSMRMLKARPTMRNSRAALIASVSVFLLIGVSGCGARTTSATNAAHPESGHPTLGGTLTYALPPQTNLTWFLPMMSASSDSNYNIEVAEQMYKPLIWINGQYQIDWTSSLAKKITYNSAGTIYHIFLNPKWHWSNGQPVTSQDVLFSWNVIRAASAPNAPDPWPFVGEGTGDIPTGFQSVVANGRYEVTVTLKHPANQQWFIYNGLTQITPLPAAVLDIHKNIRNEIKYLGDNATNPVFNHVVDGPFQMVSGTPNQEWVMVPNPHYDGHKSTVKKLIFTYEGSSAAEFAGLKTGAINYGYLDLGQYGSRQALMSMGDVITPEYTLGVYYTDLNMFPGSPTRAIFDRLYIRQAMQMGIDNSAIDQAIYHGFAPPEDGPIPSIPLTKFYSPALKTNPYPYNPAKGKALLEAHGWHEVHGIMTKGDRQLKFQMLYVSGTLAGQDEAILMKQDFSKEGIDITLKPMPFSTFISVTSNPKSPKQWQMGTGLEWTYNGPGFYPSGGELFSTGAPSGFGYSNSEEDALIRATHLPYATTDETMQHFYAYENFTAAQVPFLWGTNVATLAVHAPDLHDSVKYADAAVGFPQIQYWWISPSD